MTDPTKRSFEHLKVTRKGAIVEITLDRPKARNALNGAMIAELTGLARDLRLAPDVQAVIVAGGADYFSAGADLGGIKDRTTAPTLLQSREAVMAGPDLCRAFEEIEAVTIAAIEGYCLGGAAALALFCDFRIMAKGASLRLPEAPLGINMSWRSVPRITALIGPARAKRFIMFGEAVEAQTCLSWGMADEVVEKGQALTAARAWAGRVCALPPIPVRMSKEAVNVAANALSHAASFMDRDQYLLAARSADFQEGVAAFKEKRKPTFKGD